jgi:predicted transcriptional regulator YdeE
MDPRIETFPQKTLRGMRARMTLADDKIRVLWQRLIPRRAEIKNRTDENFYSLKYFDSSTPYADFTPHTEFDKVQFVSVTTIKSKSH